MADIEKVVVIKLELDVDKYTAEAVALNKQQKELKDRQKELKQSGQETSLEYQKNAEQLKNLSTQLRQTNKTIQDLTVANNSNAGSNEQLRAGLSVLTAEYNKLSEAERDGTTKGLAMKDEIANVTATLKANESAVGDNRRNVGNYAESIGDLKKALKDAKSEMIAAASQFGMGSQQFTEAQKKAGKLKDEIDDINQATKAMATGSGIGAFKNQLGQVGQSLRDLDFKEAAERAKGLGNIAKTISFKDTIAGAKAFIVSIYEMAAAMLTLPIVWIIAGIAAIAGAFYLMNKAASEAVQAQIKSIDTLVNGVTRLRDAQIKIAQAAGLNTDKLEEDKLKKQRLGIDKQIGLLTVLQNFKNGLNDDEKKQLDDLRGKQIENIADQAAYEIGIIKKKDEALKKETEKIKKHTEELTAYNKKKADEAAAADKKANEERLADNLKYLNEIEDQKISLIKDDESREKAKAVLDNLRKLAEITKSKADNDVKHKALEQQQETHERTIQDIEEKYAKLRKEAADKEAQEAIDKVKKDAKAEADANVDPAFSSHLKEKYDAIDKNNKDILKSTKDRIEAEKKLETDSFDFLKKGIQDIFDIKNNQREAQIQGINEETKAQIDAVQLQADTGIISEQTLETEKSRIQIDADKKTAAIKKKQFESQKKASLIQVAINTAQGVSNALTVQPAYLAAAQVAFALGTGALEAQVINSQPTPSFVGGGKVVSGQKVTASHGRSNFFSNGDDILATIKAGEVILNTRQQEIMGGAEAFRRAGVPGFADGGVAGKLVTSRVDTEVKARQEMQFLISSLPAPVVAVQDINEVQANVVRVTDRANI